MTETQAKSGNKGTSANPVDEEAAAKGGAPATGRAAVGRATVPADAPAPKFTRAPGMAPPPDSPGDDSGASDKTETSGIDAPTSAAAPAAAAGSAARPATTQPIRTGGGQSAAGSSAVTGTLPRIGGGTATKPQPDGGRPAGVGRPASGGGLPPGVAGAAAVGAARVGDAVRSARTSVSSAASRGPRRARLNLKRIDPWSVMKFAFAVSVVLFIVVVVATSVLYLALDAMGVFQSVNDSLTDLVAAGGQSSSTFQITAKGVILSSALIGLVNVVLFTALATLGAFVYNVCADLVGGIELTLAERD
ncbi:MULTISPECIES: DUF3566 domain-containing protein [unclassified Micromonospora]|uniref:DUF3566 domain-containing protein n=1 Tax=unclassified Micromonospora TaxID=2617518 RepID=UPI00098D08AE|nr:MULTISPECIES: DUF3566 domain-containing protein [unclassified Micromonospora]MDI5937304.1 DUF3566 domain-containing protein [Micromonospora sp. DH15]OON33161.1 hypothetical protein BSA16_01820 [Micromonospora sp. Rc5]